MRKRKRLGLLAIAATLFAGFGTAAQAAIIIDSFDGNLQEVVGRVSAPTAVSNEEVFGVLGGYRELFVDLQLGSRLTLAVDGGLAFEELSPDISQDIDPNVAHITWDGSSVEGGPLDLSFLANLGQEGSQFLITGTDQTIDARISIEVWDTASGHDVQDLVIPTSNNNPLGTTDYYVNFADFAGIDWFSVAALRINFLTDNVSIDQFAVVGPSTPQPVPVPAAAGLGFLGMALVAAYRRKQGAQA